MAEGGDLLNRCTVKSCTGGSNPPLSAIAFHRLLIEDSVHLLWCPRSSFTKARNGIEVLVCGFAADEWFWIFVVVLLYVVPDGGLQFFA